jgi:segregation and condensation protein B
MADRRGTSKNDRTASETAEAVIEGEDDLLPILESLLFAAHESLSAQRMARAIGHVKAERVSRGLEKLQQRYEEQRSPLMLTEIAGGWRLVTRPEFAPFLARLFSRAEKERLSSAALETLAIVAYRQPATRAEIEAVRGVQAGPVLKLLQERRLVKMVGRAEVVGRPLQYGTTRKFLDHFGLASLEELPKVFPGREPTPAAASAATGDDPDGIEVPGPDGAIAPLANGALAHDLSRSLPDAANEGQAPPVDEPGAEPMEDLGNGAESVEDRHPAGGAG